MHYLESLRKRRISSRNNFWYAWLFLLVLIVLLFFLGACSPSERLSRIIRNHPELATKSDTTFRIDTITILPASTDTVIYYKQTDTVIVKENGVTVKYYYNTRDSTVFLHGERDTILIIKEVPISANSFHIEPESLWERIWRTIKDIVAIASLGAVLVLFFLLRKSINK